MSEVAFVTGASSGIGRGLAVRLASAGYAVGLAARGLDRLDEVAAEVRARGAGAAVCPCDVGDRDQVHGAIAAAERALGPIDLLIANAGISVMTVAQELEAPRVEEVLRTNFLGSVYAAEAVLPSMLRRRSGHLVAVGSLTGYGGLPKSAAYSASKAAMHKFFESLRLDLRGTGVGVTVITPGYVRTEQTRKNLFKMPFVLEVEDAAERMYAAIRDKRPHLAFPRPLSSLIWIAQVFPRGIYDAIASKARRDKRD
jgi:short-subunit dehydrogenase